MSTSFCIDVFPCGPVFNSSLTATSRPSVINAAYTVVPNDLKQLVYCEIKKHTSKMSQINTTKKLKIQPICSTFLALFDNILEQRRGYHFYENHLIMHPCDVSISLEFILFVYTLSTDSICIHVSIKKCN